MHPPFESVYDNVVGFGRTKSISYRMWKGARKAAVWQKVEEKSVRKRYRRAVKNLRQARLTWTPVWTSDTVTKLDDWCS